jgi:hypothetical protein
MLKMVVGPNKQHIQDASGQISRVYPLLISTRYGPCHLEGCGELPEVRGVEIRVKRWYLPFFRRKVHAPSHIKAAIAVFLNRYHLVPAPDFDCYAFACLAYSIDPQTKAELRNYWDIHPMRFWPKVGTVVFLLSKEKTGTRFRHAAIYLGMGLYISVWGAGGHLEIATLRDMKKDFRATEVLFATGPKTAAS